MPNGTPATDEAFNQRQQEQDQALRNYKYLVQHPDEASKYGMDPADFRPKAAPQGTPDPNRAELSAAPAGEEGAGADKDSASAYSPASEYAQKGLDDAKAWFTQGLFGDAAGWLAKKAGVTPEHAATIDKVVNVVANAAGFIPAKAEEAGGEAIEAMRGAGEDTSTLGKVIEGPTATPEGAPVAHEPTVAVPSTDVVRRVEPEIVGNHGDTTDALHAQLSAMSEKYGEDATNAATTVVYNHLHNTLEGPQYEAFKKAFPQVDDADLLQYKHLVEENGKSLGSEARFDNASEAVVSPNGETQAASEGASAGGQPQASLNPDGTVNGDPKTLTPPDEMLYHLHNILNTSDENAQRVYRSNATTMAAADNVSSGRLEQLLGRPGTNLNAEQQVALEQVMEKQGEGLRAVLNEAAQTKDPARLQQLKEEFIDRASGFTQWNEYAEAASRESGRGQQARQIPAIADMINKRKQFAEDIRNYEQLDPAGFQRLALAIGGAPDGLAASDIAARASEPGVLQRVGDVALKYAMNAGLSSTTLPARKLKTDAVQLAVKILAHTINGNIFKCPDVPQGLATSELHGTWAGLADGFRYAARRIVTGTDLWAEEHGVSAPSGYGTEGLENTRLGKALQYLNVMSRPIQALGDFANGVFYRVNEHAAAWREASAAARSALGDGATAKELYEATTPRYAAKMRVLPKSIREAAMNGTEVDTFRNSTALMQGVEDLRDKIDKQLFGIPLARLTLMFYRTTWNLDKADMSLSPLGWGSVARNWGQEGNSTQAVKAALGTTAMGLAMYLHHTGRMTGGGPADPEQRKAWLLHNQPYSMLIDGKWHKIPDIPGTGILRVVGDIADIYPQMPSHDVSHMMSMLEVVGARYLEHQPFMSLITAVADHMTQSLRGESSNEAKSTGDTLSNLLVPQAVRSVATAIDPKVRDTRDPDSALKTFVNEWKEKIPGLSKSLPPNVNGFGDSHYITGGYKPADAPGYWMKIDHFLGLTGAENVDNDPLYKELDRLHFDPPRPSRALAGRVPGDSPFKNNDPHNKAGYVLDPWEYHDLCVAAGKPKYDYMSKVVASKAYQDATDSDKLDWLNTIDKSFNQAAADRMAARPDIQQKIVSQERQQDLKRSGKVSVAAP